MPYLTKNQRKTAQENSKKHNKNYTPVARFTSLGDGKEWLLTELHDDDLAFGLLQIKDEIKLDFFSLKSLDEYIGTGGSEAAKRFSFSKEEIAAPGLMSDIAFEGSYPISVYYKVSEHLGFVTTDHIKYSNLFSKYGSSIKGNETKGPAL